MGSWLESFIIRLAIFSCIAAVIIGTRAEACDEDDLTDYVVWVDIMPDGKNGWKFIK